MENKCSSVPSAWADISFVTVRLSERGWAFIMVQMHSLSWCYLSIMINQAQVLQHLWGYWLVKKLVQRPLSGACMYTQRCNLTCVVLRLREVSLPDYQ